MSTRTIDLVTDFTPAPPGWTVHQFYVVDDGPVEHEQLPLAGWVATAAHRLDRWDDIAPTPEAGRAHLPAVWSNQEMRLIDAEELDLAINNAIFVTGPGQGTPPMDWIQERLTEKRRAAEKRQARRTS